MIIWLASYPKSGNTWLRFFIISLLMGKQTDLNLSHLRAIMNYPHSTHFNDLVSNLFNLDEISKNWITTQKKINSDKKLRFFKTHNILGAINGNKFTNIKNTIACIYIVRDPRNVISSLKNHYELNNDEALKFMTNENKFIYDYHSKNDYGDFQFISSWEKNYKSWACQNVFPVKIIKYENLNHDTFNVFKDLIQFIDKIKGNKNIFNKKKAENVIHSCSFDKLKNIEINEGFSESIISKNKSEKIPFFHLGPANDWKKTFDEEYKKKLNKIFAKNLKELEYN